MKTPNIIGPVSIIAKPQRPSLGIRFQTSFDGMFAVVTRELKMLRKWVNAHALADQGPYFLRYYVTDMKGTMDVEVGLITRSRLAGEGRIRPDALPRGRYATLQYKGNGLRANQAMMRWAVDHGVTFDRIDAGSPQSYASRYEAYLTDYRIEPRKLLWETELSIKIAEA